MFFNGFPGLSAENLIFMDFSGFPSPWDSFKSVRIEKSSKMPQDLRQIVEYVAGNGSHTFEKFTFNTFVKN